MHFQLDKQTIIDLDLFKEDRNSKSIYSYFNVVKTMGGRTRLKAMMLTPSGNQEELERRTASINFFIHREISLDVRNQQVDFIEHYLESDLLILKNMGADIAMQAAKNAFSVDKDYYLISTGIQNIIYTLKSVMKLVHKINAHDLPDYVQELAATVLALESNERLRKIMNEIDLSKRENETNLSIRDVFALDKVFRSIQRNNTKAFLKAIYEFDVLLALAKVGRENNLTMPEYINSESCFVEAKQLFHPLLDAPVSNNFNTGLQNVCFLTGPNMAGKSTFLKSLALSVYLAHIGFPIPAKLFKTSIFDGIMTTINLPDSIYLGYSHFLGEVKRVKEAVLRIKEGQRQFIIFDELFKGTNVKDAYEASVLIIKGFTKCKNSAIIISTHLIEIAEELEGYDNIAFRYLDVSLEKAQPRFSYKLKEGVSKDRIGMIIVQNEGIIDMLDELNS